jgi:glycosyltransferase involved in cell wall biosynthesis
MIIAVNTVFFPGAHSSKEKEWIVPYFSRLAALQPEHQFIFISNDKLATIPVAAGNTSFIVTGQVFKSVIGLNLWYNYRLPGVLKKIKADVLVNVAGIACLRTTIPQLLMLDDTQYLEPSKRLNRAGRYFKKKLPVFLKKAQTILLSTAYAKEMLGSNFPTASDQLKVLQPGIDENFQPIDWEEKEKWKDRLTGGKEYFLFTGAVHGSADLINLLKAFSLFKKRQKSNMQLLMLTDAGENAAFMEAFKTYKYREEVLLMSDTGNATFQHMIAAAYAIVCPANGNGFDPLPLQAMRCETPVIAFNNDALADLVQDAALFVNPADPQQTANTLMLLFKDETERNRLIGKGTALSATFSWDKSAAALWQHILETANQ